MKISRSPDGSFLQDEGENALDPDVSHTAIPVTDAQRTTLLD
jgi:hypothetical protein